MAQMSVDAKNAHIRCDNWHGAVPSQSQETDILRITLTYTMLSPKKSMVALVDSVMRSISSSSAIDHRLSEPGTVWISPFPMRPSAQPMPRFLFDPPKPPMVWPLKWVSVSMES